MLSETSVRVVALQNGYVILRDANDGEYQLVDFQGNWVLGRPYDRDPDFPVTLWDVWEFLGTAIR